MYYVGGSGKVDVTDGPNIERGSVSPHSFLYGGELGYGLTLASLVVLRAQLGLGDEMLGMGGGVAIGPIDDNITTFAQPVRTTNYLYLEPGVTGLVEFGKVYAGVDVNALLLPSGPKPVSPTGAGFSAGAAPFSSSHTLDSAVTVHAQVGVRF
jgi:hypothetical protein